MRFTTALSTALLLTSSALASIAPAANAQKETRALHYVVEPKVVIISMFEPEGDVWYGIPDFNVLEKNITVEGLSPLYPDVHCTANGDICQLILGESEINAACSVTALLSSPRFSLKSTYFLIAGIAGVNPEIATLGSVTFARYAIQVALQYEFDAREIPDNFTTGYVPQGAYAPGQYPQSIYGTEVFEVNVALRDLAMGYASTAVLNDSDTAIAYRANYASTAAYAAGAMGPSVVAGDVATSDVYYSGALLSEAFGNYTTLVTNGSGIYATTAQEDNATLEAMLRAALFKLVDFSRIIVMRTCSDFDRPYAGEPDTVNLLYADQGGFEIALQNIYLAGIKVVEGILADWECTFKEGVNVTNYIGDIFGSLGGTPDFGLPADFIGDQVIAKRALMKAARARRGLPAMPVRLAPYY